MSADNRLHCRIWLLLLNEGGRWCSRAIADSLKVDANSVQSACESMVKTAMLQRHEKTATARRITFGVGEGCKMPYGLTLADVRGASIYHSPNVLHCGAEGVM